MLKVRYIRAKSIMKLCLSTLVLFAVVEGYLNGIVHTSNTSPLAKTLKIANACHIFGAFPSIIKPVAFGVPHTRKTPHRYVSSAALHGLMPFLRAAAALS